MKLVADECPRCGGPVVVGATDERVTCSYCRTSLRVERKEVARTGYGWPYDNLTDYELAEALRRFYEPCERPAPRPAPTGPQSQYE